MNNRIFQIDNNYIEFNNIYSIDGYSTYNVTVVAGFFSGCCTFCIHHNDINEHIIKINNMITTLSGKLKIFDCESDAYLEFYFVNQQNFYVIGQVGGSHEDNVLKFKLKADQTLLLKLRENLLDY